MAVSNLYQQEHVTLIEVLMTLLATRLFGLLYKEMKVAYGQEIWPAGPMSARIMMMQELAGVSDTLKIDFLGDLLYIYHYF